MSRQPPLSISVAVSPTGKVTARSWRDGTEQSSDHRVALMGLEGRTLRVFERWLMEHDREWDREDIRVFGQLLHQLLFSDKVWTWIRHQIDNRGDDTVRLQLEFPTDAASSRLATLPWEFMCGPDRPGDDGQFLVLMPGVLLSRSVPPGTPYRATVDLQEVRILPVVGAHNDWLGNVDYKPVVRAIKKTAKTRPDFTVCKAAVDVSEDELARTVAEKHPHVVHYIGHGRFNSETGKGSIALKGAAGREEWIDEDRLAESLCTDDWAPTVVVLHACEGGANDYEYRYAGLAPVLVGQGVHCVVAMQYPVTNETAIAFSTALYEALACHEFLDQAVQSARKVIWQDSKDARLLGVPMIYQRTAEPLLGEKSERAKR
ncbi:CHAT domain-containing protein [Kribbella sp. NPDC050820]|uniref:CHAT domain-containing protein n=1 Tax=Kribbella sp. NPDC050820 TaxID=3155408 RepID=UPI0033FDB29A